MEPINRPNATMVCACLLVCLPAPCWLHSGAVLKMRKLIPCYLHGFGSARHLQGQLFAAQTMTEWQAAICDPDHWGFDPAEPFHTSALRQARLKGAGQVRGGAQQRIVLPPGWLDEANDDGEVPQCLDEACCEG